MSSHKITPSSLTRRNFMLSAGAVAAASTLGGSIGFAQSAIAATGAGGTYSLPDLPYAYNALEPQIDAETMKIHHTKHHQAYVNNLNAALASHPDLRSKTLVQLLQNLDQVPEDIRTAVRNNGGGHYNHTLFWNTMGKGKGGAPTGELAQAIADSFGGFPAFKEKFAQAAARQFGSGWAWLSVDKDGKLVVEGLPNQDNPLMHGRQPIVGLDVWEHAYYLKYRNLRGDYVGSWWEIVDWDQVAKNYAEATKRK